MVELGKEDTDVDSASDNPDTNSNISNIGMKQSLHVTSDSETQSDNLPPTHESPDPKVNLSGEVKTSRYTKRVKPPLPRRPRKKKGSQQPPRISSRLAEKCKNEVLRKHFIICFLEINHTYENIFLNNEHFRKQMQIALPVEM